MVDESTTQEVRSACSLRCKVKKLYCQLHKQFHKGNHHEQREHLVEFIESPKHESFSHVYSNSEEGTAEVTAEEAESPVSAVNKSHYTWCHSDLSRLDAQEKLLSTTEEGMYLIRRSSQPEIPHVLSVYHQEKVYHMKIRQIEEKFMIGDTRSKEPVFDSLLGLVTHFQRVPIYLKHDKSDKALLRVPLPH